MMESIVMSEFILVSSIGLSLGAFQSFFLEDCNLLSFKFFN